MKSSQRVLVNTLAQYSRTIINMLLSLYTARLVLATLGQSDFGIYSLVAGVISMLSFITNSLVSTTQRFLSVYQGIGNKRKLREIFSNSVLVHLIIALIVIAILESVTPLLFNGFLNIPSDRIEAATKVYQIVVFMILFSLLSSPFRALLVSHENIVYISFIDVCDAVLKLILVTILAHSDGDKLIFYGLIMLSINVFGSVAIILFSSMRYEECCMPSLKSINKQYLAELFSYAGWSVYTTGCITMRREGVAVILNKFLGTVVNAAYGIGFQLSGYMNFLSSSLSNAISPQIMKSEGSGNRERAIWLSNITSKMVFFLLSLICIPCCFEINNVLRLWLGDVPANTGLFCIMVMLEMMVDSLTFGLTTMNNAIGKIGLYSFVMNTPKLLALPVCWFLIMNGYNLFWVLVVNVAIEFICSLIRLPFVSRRAGFEESRFLKDVILREIIPVLSCVIVCVVTSNLICVPWRLLWTFGLSSIIYSILFYYIGLTHREKDVILDIVHGCINYIKNQSGK